jgi:hypothetical protein
MVQREDFATELGRQGLDREGVCEREFVILDNFWLDYIIAWERGERGRLLLRVTGMDSGFVKPVQLTGSHLVATSLRKLLLHSCSKF